MFRHMQTTLLRRSVLGASNIVRRRIQYSAAEATRERVYSMRDSFTHSDADGFVRHSSYGSVEVPDLRIDQFVWQNMQQWHNRTALVCGETDRELTYAQLRDRCAALAVRLQHADFGLQKNDVVALCLPNSPDFVIAALGTLEAGYVVTSVNPIYTADEIAKQLINSHAKILIGTVEGHTVLQQAIAKAQQPIRLVCVRSHSNQKTPNGCIDFAQLDDPHGIDFSALKSSQRHTDFDPNGVAFLPYSSGTTGLPKGVMLSHNNITVNCLQIDAPMPILPLAWSTTADHQDVLPCVLPFFHIYGFTVLLASKLAKGCKIVTLRQFAPDTFMKSLVVQKGTLVFMVPPIVNFLASHPSVKAEHLQNIRHTMCGAAPIGASDVERFMAKVNRPDIDFRQGYGLTETAPGIAMNISGSKRYASSGGLTPNTEVKIVDLNDETMRGLPVNQSGELLVRGPQVMLGYHENAKATADIMLPGGWMRTGDVAHFDEDGYLYVTDRLKELIKVKGFQVAPAELETILRSHPKVADAAVVGMSHPTCGEVPLAFVVRKEEAGGADPVTEKDLQQFVADQAAVFKRLDGGVRFVEQIPKSNTGKILRRQIRQEHGIN